jgi:hypothetical protein
VESHHTVEEQVILALGDDLCLVVFGEEDRKLPQVGADEVPNAFFGACRKFEAVFKATIWLIGRNN